MTLRKCTTASSYLIAAVSGLAACCALAQTSESTPGAGIWKAVVPPTAMKGAFDNFDPIGIAAGARIKADCSLNWVNPDDGTRYCFSSGTSLEFFLDNPNTAIERARAGWRKLAGQSAR